MNVEPMTLIVAFNIVLSIATAALGWLAKGIFDRLSDIEREQRAGLGSLNDLKVNLPTNYVGKSDFNRMGDDIFSVLRRIEDKLDHKQDKP